MELIDSRRYVAFGTIHILRKALVGEDQIFSSSTKNLEVILSHLQLIVDV